MRVEEADHQGRLQATERQFIAVSNEHKWIPTSMRESALTGFHEPGFGSVPDRRKLRPSKGEMRQAPVVLLPSPRAILRDDDNAGAQDGRIDGETRMRSSPGKPPSRTRSYFIQYLSLLLRCPSTPRRW